MKTKFVKYILLIVTAVALGSTAMADHRNFEKQRLSAKLDGFQESPSIMTQGTGHFQAKLGEEMLLFKLTYKNLTGTAQAAHIHFARPGVNGGIIVFLCDNDPGPYDVPTCPAEGETLEGQLTANDVREIANQGVSAGDFNALIRAIRNGAAYVNVHTDAFPPGEIRGNIRLHKKIFKKK